MFTERELEAIRPRLMRLALKLTKGRREEAEDVVQDAYVNAWRSRATYDGRSPLATWVSTILANRQRDHLRSAKRRPSEVKQSEAPEAWMDLEDILAVDDAYFAADLDPAILAALADLGYQRARVARLCFIDGYSYEEAADALRVPVGTVRSRVFRARRDLRPALAHLST